jgi:hypothetical protein
MRTAKPSSSRAWDIHAEAHQKPVDTIRWNVPYSAGVLMAMTIKAAAGAFDYQRNLCFTHRFQETALGLRRGAIDLVGQHDAGEIGPGMNSNSCFCRLNMETPTMSKAEIAGESNALERTVQRSGKLCASVV